MYTLQLLPDDKEQISASRYQIVTDAARFVADSILSYDTAVRHKTTSPGPRLLSLGQDLLHARFWGVLNGIDGYASPHKLEESIITRAWAQERFTPHQLEQLLNIAVNQALLKPYKTAWPGTNKGHSILYRELVEKEESRFAQVVTVNFRRRLNNGRFWENIPDLQRYRGESSFSLMNDVLENHFTDLDPQFVPQGLELMNAAASDIVLSPEIRFLSKTALNRYKTFISSLTEIPSQLQAKINP